MPNTFEGDLQAPDDARFGLVVARFNDFISEKLLDGALDTLQRHGVDAESVDVARCPGAFEIPIVARRLAASEEYEAVICLGAVIRGDTPHFDYVAGEAAKGTAQAALDADVPVLFGVLTTDTVQQAIERAGSKAGNKGSEAAEAALETVTLMRTLPGS